MLEETGNIGTTKATVPMREAAEKSSRVKYLCVSHECLLSLLRQGDDGKFVRIKGMPADAMIVGFSDEYTFRTNHIAVKVWSESFPVVVDGATMQELTLECSLYEEKQKTTYESIETCCTTKLEDEPMQLVRQRTGDERPATNCADLAEKYRAIRLEENNATASACAAIAREISRVERLSDYNGGWKDAALCIAKEIEQLIITPGNTLINCTAESHVDDPAIKPTMKDCHIIGYETAKAMTEELHRKVEEEVNDLWRISPAKELVKEVKEMSYQEATYQESSQVCAVTPCELRAPRLRKPVPPVAKSKNYWEATE